MRLTLILTCCLAAGCGAGKAPVAASSSSQRDVAQRFAEAILAGRADAAVRLLSRSNDVPLSRLARRAARPWTADHAHIVSRQRTGRRWTFRYTGRHTHADGSFEDVHGDVIAIVGTAAGRSVIEFFALRRETVRFSTHHDSQLLPSNR